MARKLRVQYPGAIYHAMNLGDHSEAVFRDAHDPKLFLGTLAEACNKTDWQVHSFVEENPKYANLLRIAGVG